MNIRVNLNIKQEYIDKGIIASLDRCPIGLSLEDLGYSPIVCGNVIQISKDGKVYECIVTKSVNKFICTFDDGLDVNPTKFRLQFKNIPYGMYTGEIK